MCAPLKTRETPWQWHIWRRPWRQKVWWQSFVKCRRQTGQQPGLAFEAAAAIHCYITSINPMICLLSSQPLWKWGKPWTNLRWKRVRIWPNCLNSWQQWATGFGMSEQLQKHNKLLSSSTQCQRLITRSWQVKDWGMEMHSATVEHLQVAANEFALENYWWWGPDQRRKQVNWYWAGALLQWNLFSMQWTRTQSTSVSEQGSEW